VGTFPFMIMALIYRNVPRKRANELLLLGERWSAQEGRWRGRRQPRRAELRAGCAGGRLGGRLAGRSPVIMRLGKEAMRRQLDMPLDDALDYLRAQLSLALSTEDIGRGCDRVLRRSASRSGRAADESCCARCSRTSKPRRAQIRLGGGEEKIAAQHQREKLTARGADRAADR